MARIVALWLAGALGCALTLEILFRALPVSTSTNTGYYTDPLILTYPPHHRWTVSTGWDLRNAQTLRANNIGYVADRDFRPDENAVALVGDSFVEASMLDAADRPGAQLERLLGARPVYSMGNPGTALLDYAERIRFAREHFGVRNFVVLMERGDILQSVCGSGHVNGPCLDGKTLAPRNEPLPSPSAVKRILRHSALAQYLVSQIKFDVERLRQQALVPTHTNPITNTDSRPDASRVPSFSQSDAIPTRIDTIAQTFFARVKPHIDGRLVIVVDSDRAALRRGELPFDPARARFIELARAAGLIVVDTEAIYRDHFDRSPLSLNVGPYDAHLNELGIMLIAKAAASALTKP